MMHLSLPKARKKMNLRSILKKKGQRTNVVLNCQLGRKNQQGERETRKLQPLQNPVHLRKLHRSDHQQNEIREMMSVIQVQRRLLRERSLKKLPGHRPLQSLHQKRYQSSVVHLQATFKDIIKELAKEFKDDLTSRIMIQSELTKSAEVADEEEEEEKKEEDAKKKKAEGGSAGGEG